MRLSETSQPLDSLCTSCVYLSCGWTSLIALVSVHADHGTSANAVVSDRVTLRIRSAENLL